MTENMTVNKNNDVFADISNLSNIVIEPFDFTNDMEIILSGDWDIDSGYLRQPLTSSPRPETPDDLPHLISFEPELITVGSKHPCTTTKVSLRLDSTENQDDELDLPIMSQYNSISCGNELKLISDKLAKLEKLITSKLDRYHRMVRRQSCPARQQTNCPLSRHQTTNEPNLVNYGTIINNGPCYNTTDLPFPSTPVGSNSNGTAPDSTNPDVSKWIAKLTPILKTIFEEQPTNIDMKYSNELLDNICSSLSQYAENIGIN